MVVKIIFSFFKVLKIIKMNAFVRQPRIEKDLLLSKYDTLKKNCPVGIFFKSNKFFFKILNLLL